MKKITIHPITRIEGHASVTVQLSGGAQKRLATFSPGMAFGEMAMLDRAPRWDSERVREILVRRQVPAIDLAEIRRLVLEHDGVDYARERAAQYAQAAKADLDLFPPSEEREILALIADFVVDRDR